VRIVVATLIVALMLSGCGGSSDAAKASGKTRLFDTQRDALDKANRVSETLRQADQARRAQEEQQTQ
jgi:TolA-binding protein